jgi:hypothetical protein
MKLLIKINEPHRDDTLVLDHVRPAYIFTWSKQHEAFIFEPKDQAQTDDIFAAQRFYRGLGWVFVPLVVNDDGAPIASTSVATEQALRDELAEKDRNLTAALKRIDQLNDALAKAKVEYDRIAAAAKALAAPEPAEPPVRVKVAKPHWKTLEKQAKAAASAQPTATEDDIPDA